MPRVPNATLVDRVDLQFSKDCGLTCFPNPLPNEIFGNQRITVLDNR